jgi:hypothetical protein
MILELKKYHRGTIAEKLKNTQGSKDKEVSS